MWLLALLGVILLGAIGFLGFQLLGNSPSPSASPVVGVVGAGVRERRVDDAAIAGERHGPGARRGGARRPRTSKRAGSSAASRRAASGSSEGSTLVVFVSSGPGEVAVPRLRGQTEQQARETLADFDLRVGSVDREPDPSIPDGSVIRSSPAEGVDVESGSQVDLVHQQRADAVTHADAHSDADADSHPDADPDAFADALSDAASAVNDG